MKGSGLRRSRSRWAEHDPAPRGLLAVDLVGDPLPDILVIRPGECPALARNLGNGHHWLALRLGGHWRVKPELMRTNSHAIGTRVTLEGQGIYVPYDHTTPDSGLGQSVAPVVLGLGAREQADLVHLSWPDGVMQCELNQVANQQVDLAENNRKTGSCPVLFTWNGERYVCIGDFLGGGGMGYLVAPGSIASPTATRRWPSPSEQLQTERGHLPALDHRADGRDRLSRSLDARRGRPAARACRRHPTSGSLPRDRGRPASSWPGERRSSPTAPPISKAAT